MRKKYIVTNPVSGSNIMVDSINLPTGTSQEFELETAKYLLRIYGFLSLEEKQIEDFYNNVDTAEEKKEETPEVPVPEKKEETPPETPAASDVSPKVSDETTPHDSEIHTDSSVS